MKTKAVLFDLDGTLLPMDQDIFIKEYFKALSKKMSGYGYDPSALVKSVWECTLAMINNDGQRTNKDVFWSCFEKIYGSKVKDDIPWFDEFYVRDFDSIRHVCSFNSKARQTVTMLRDRAITVILATNPIFPSVATQARIGWAGLRPDDFALYTTYENMHYCKPSLKYYNEILSRFDLSPEECIMVGNDVDEDMIVTEIGMRAFLLTDYLINKSNADISVYPNGSYNDLNVFLIKNI